MRKSRLEQRVEPYTTPFDVNNPIHSVKPNFTFLQTYDGKITKYRLQSKDPTPRFQYVLCIHNPTKIVNDNYIVIMKKTNGKPEEIYSLETPIEVKTLTIYKQERTATKLVGNTNSCRFYIGSGYNIRCGKYRIFLYKQVQEPKTLINYLYTDKHLTGAYVTLASIRQTINHHKGDKIDRVPRITFRKNQLVPIGDKHIIIIDNEYEFMKWLDNKIDSTTEKQVDSETQVHIRQAIKTYLTNNPNIKQLLHPSYIESACDTLVTSIYTDFTTNIFELYMNELIQKHITNVPKPQFTQIMDSRLKKYGQIFMDNGLNIEKLTSIFTEHNLDAKYLQLIIKDNYHWFIINEAIDIVKSHPQYTTWKQSMEKITNEVYGLFRQILMFETHHYKEEKEIHKI